MIAIAIQDPSGPCIAVDRFVRFTLTLSGGATLVQASVSVEVSGILIYHDGVFEEPHGWTGTLVQNGNVWAGEMYKAVGPNFTYDSDVTVRVRADDNLGNHGDVEVWVHTAIETVAQPVNPEFEDADATPGSAVGWTVAASQAGWRHALLGDDAAERFTWNAHEDSFDDVVSAAAPDEDLEAGWSNDSWTDDLADLTTASAAFQPSAPEAFGRLWGTNGAGALLDDLSEVTTVQAIFAGPANEERFDGAGWQVASWTDDLGAVQTATALFDWQAQDVEDFEDAWGFVLVSLADTMATTDTVDAVLNQ